MSEMPGNDDEDVSEAKLMDVFCARQHDAWRIYVRPGWLPRHLQQHLDPEGEAYPTQLDFEDLDRHMHEHQAAFERQTSGLGGVRLTAHGSSAEALAHWLAGVFGTAMRPRAPDLGESG
ncbi:MAG TPA: hypothetical protein VJV79_01130 [Polyangiaceae bacterium]|nr:hypothetical protein [Polyangiaceae bacterium]